MTDYIDPGYVVIGYVESIHATAPADRSLEAASVVRRIEAPSTSRSATAEQADRIVKVR